MASLTRSSKVLLSSASSEHTHTTFGGVRDVSGSVVDLTSDCPDYEWVDPRVLDVSTCFRGPTALDVFFV